MPKGFPCRLQICGAGQRRLVLGRFPVRDIYQLEAQAQAQALKRAPELSEAGGAPVAPHRNARAWETFANLIAGAWRKQAVGIIETAQYLHEAKQELGRAEFEAMAQLELPFEASVGRKLLRIAGCPLLCAPGHISKLPPNWTLLYELTKADAVVLKAAFEDGRIHPKMSRKDALALRPKKIPDSTEADTAPKTEHSAGEEQGLCLLRLGWGAVSPALRRQWHDEVGLPDMIASMSPDMLAELEARALRSLEQRLSSKQRGQFRTLLNSLKTPPAITLTPVNSTESEAA
jgi:hypothetical protein